MKKSLLALAVLGAFAGAAQAQTNVTIYGQLDVGLTKSSGATTAENAGDNNKIGFKGTEDLGGGLAALFQAEIRFDPNTGKTEGGGTRPLFQGSSVVGLTGGFGTLRLGRALTAMQATMPAFDPWGADRNRGAFFPLPIIGSGTGIYSSTPLEPTNSAANRFSNGVFYTTPTMSGFQGALSLQTKQKQDAATLPDNMAFSAAGSYFNGPVGAGLSYEKNAIGDHIVVVGGSYKVGTANLMATYSKVSAGDAAIAAADTTVTHAAEGKAWSIGTNIDVGTGNVLAAYGKIKPDSSAITDTKKFSVGYEHRLSKRTFLYVDAIRLNAATDTNTFDVGLHHNF